MTRNGGNAASVRFDSVTKAYTKAKIALRSFSLEVEPGSFTVLLGPSGSGKTTLLRSLAGIEGIDGGTIAIGDKEVARGGWSLPPERRELAMVFQDYALWPHMTVVDNVAFALKRRTLSPSARKERAMAMLERMRLSKLSSCFPNELSGGEQQRVSLARALIGECPLILFDEPLSNLDADLREQMRLEISTLARESGATSIYITHDQSEAFALADAIGVLREGELLQYADPETLYHSPANAFIARFTGVAGELSGVLSSVSPDGQGRVLVRGKGAASFTGRVLDTTAMHSPSVAVAIRAAAVRLDAVDAPSAQVRGRVTDVAYRGRGYDVAVELACGGFLSSIYSNYRLKRDTNVGITLDPEGTLIYPSTKAIVAPIEGEESFDDTPEAANVAS
jgi:ABC-type Fe3+/spermidine/putrescine transport system ATPase subunit